MPFIAEKIRVMSLGVFKHNEKILVVPGYDSKKNEQFFRLPGGGIDFGETSGDALHREMQEEFGEEISNVKFLEVIENIFSYDGQKGHEIIFLFEGAFFHEDFYTKKILMIKDSDEKIHAEWMPIKKFLSGEKKLYPTINYQKKFLTNKLKKGIIFS